MLPPYCSKTKSVVTPRLVNQLVAQIGELQEAVAELRERVGALEQRKTNGVADLRERVESFSLFEAPIEGSLEARSFSSLGSDALLGIIRESEDRGRELGREAWESEQERRKERELHERDHYDQYGHLIHSVDEDYEGSNCGGLG